MHAWRFGFTPELERNRRSAGGEERSYLDMFIIAVGAFLGNQDCSKVVACRTGKMMASELPGSGVFVLMLDSLVPASVRVWWDVVKVAVVDPGSDCEGGFTCTLHEEVSAAVE